MALLLSVLELFWTFFKIGAFTFGGGYAMLPLVQAAVVEHGWLSETQIVNFIAVSESTPGPFAINISTYVGSQRGGVLFDGSVLGSIFGAFVATLGVVLPSFIVILIVARFFEKFKKSKTVSGCMSGLKPAVVGLIAKAVVSIGSTVFLPAGELAISMLATLAFYASLFTSPVFYVSVGIFALMMVLSMKKISPIYIIVGSAVLGIAAGYIFNIQI